MYTSIRWQQRFQNFTKAFLSLEESRLAFHQKPTNLFIRDSYIQRYEYTIELAWKTIKDYLENEGFSDISSPKKAIRQAFQSGFIKDGGIWLKALDDRNKTSHIYNEAIALEVLKGIDEQYFLLLQDLYFFFKTHFNET